MFWRLPRFGLVLVLLTAACSSKSDTVVSNSPADRYVESVNNVSGSFTVDGIFNHDKKPYTRHTHAGICASRKKSRRSKQTGCFGRPARKTSFTIRTRRRRKSTDAEAAAEEFDEVLHNRDARGVVFRVPVGDRRSDSKVRPFFNGNDYDFGNLVLELKSNSAEKVEGQIKSNVSSQQFDINFSVNVQPDVWTGGTFYQQPPTKLSARTSKRTTRDRRSGREVQPRLRASR